jgi:hypothetical protein
VVFFLPYLPNERFDVRPILVLMIYGSMREKGIREHERTRK